MGYYINLRDAEFHIKKENFRPCLKAIKSLCSNRNYKWVSSDEVKEAETLKKAFEAWNWDIEMNDEGDVDGICFNGEKQGDEEALFQKIAPYVENGSYIEVSGEEDCVWRWEFIDGRLQTKDAVLDWDCNGEIVHALLEHKELLPTLLHIHPALDARIAAIMKE